MGGPGSGRKRTGGISRPETFSVNPNKVRSAKLPKSIKKAGINSLAYKNWIKKNWT